MIALIIFLIFFLMGHKWAGAFFAAIYIANMYFNYCHAEKLKKKYTPKQLEQLKLINFKSS